MTVPGNLSSCRLPEFAQPLDAEPVAVGELVVAIPAPRGDHRQHESSAISEQVVIDAWVVVSDLIGCVGQVELDRPPAARLEVDEQGASRGAEQVAGVRFAVQKLFGSAAVADRS